MASRKRRKSEPAPGWAWMLFGLSIGLTVALVVYLQNGPSRVADLPRTQVTQAESAGGSDSQPESSQQETVAQSADTSVAPSDEPVTASDDADEIDFSFPRLLEESEVVVADSEFDFGLDQESSQRTLIQAGSFRTPQGADTRRADVAMLGFESFVQHTTVNGDRYYQVMIGPISGRGELNRTRRRLRTEGIETAIRELPN